MRGYDAWLLSGHPDEPDAPPLPPHCFDTIRDAAVLAYRDQLDLLFDTSPDGILQVPNPLSDDDIAEKLYELYEDDEDAWSNDFFLYAPDPKDLRDEARAEQAHD